MRSITIILYFLISITTLNSPIEAAQKKTHTPTQKTQSSTETPTCVICLEEVTQDQQLASKYWHCHNIDHGATMHASCANQVILSSTSKCPLCKEPYKIRNYQRIHKKRREELRLRPKLIQAIKEHNGKKIGKIFAAGVNFNTPDENGKTLLHEAVHAANPSLVQFFLDFGATKSVNESDKYDITPLHIAAFTGNKIILKMLFDAGADPRILKEPDYYGKTPLDYAKIKNNPEIIEFLQAINQS